MKRHRNINVGRGLREQLGYISEDQAAGIFGVTVPTFRNRQSAGHAPPHYKVGREKLVPPRRSRRVDQAGASRVKAKAQVDPARSDLTP